MPKWHYNYLPSFIDICAGVWAAGRHRGDSGVTAEHHKPNHEQC